MLRDTGQRELGRPDLLAFIRICGGSSAQHCAESSQPKSRCASGDSRRSPFPRRPLRRLFWRCAQTLPRHSGRVSEMGDTV
eukprot:16450854-Heterocapsa_arctica.AAC.1